MEFIKSLFSSKATVSIIEEYSIVNNCHILCIKGTWYKFKDFHQESIGYIELNNKKYYLT